MPFEVTRYHDISVGHRVCGHESKCAHLHGHNYRVHFTVTSKRLDSIGRVVDFSVIKERLCLWLENNWDHRFLVFYQDPLAEKLQELDPTVCIVGFNPTAENIAKFLVDVVGPAMLDSTGLILTSVRVDETAKCSGSYHV